MFYIISFGFLFPKLVYERYNSHLVVFWSRTLLFYESWKILRVALHRWSPPFHDSFAGCNHGEISSLQQQAVLVCGLLTRAEPLCSWLRAYVPTAVFILFHNAEIPRRSQVNGPPEVLMGPLTAFVTFPTTQRPVVDFLARVSVDVVKLEHELRKPLASKCHEHAPGHRSVTLE